MAFEQYFLSQSSQSWAAYHDAIAATQQVLRERYGQSPYSGATPDTLAAAVAELDPCPVEGNQLKTILNNLGSLVGDHSVAVAHPNCIAHLHCPPLIPALAAEVLISATNQSLDSWDQSPVATFLEQRLVNWLTQEFGYPASADGTFTSGGTQSNLMGMLLARDYYCQTHLHWSIKEHGLPATARRFRILCSQVAHFTVKQAAAVLGLGEQAVVPVATDEHYRLSPQAMEQQLQSLLAEDLIPIAMVATAGTTDFGSIDPLPELATLAQQYGLWLHVDAAYGGGLILSDRHRHQLTGIADADSLTVDFHKLFYQPISCGAFLLRDRAHFQLMERHAAYLNPKTNASAGIPDLVTQSLQTTRRFDALKLWVSLQTLGRKGFAELVDTTLALAHHTAETIAADPALELANQPQMNAIVFRYLAATDKRDRLNQGIRQTLMENGDAVIAQTEIAGEVYLKLTLLNPRTTHADITTILQKIKQIAQQWETDYDCRSNSTPSTDGSNPCRTNHA